jgi:hypothetical protein
MENATVEKTPKAGIKIALPPLLLGNIRRALSGALERILTRGAEGSLLHNETAEAIP